MSMVSFCTPWKHEKTSGFLMFSGVSGECDIRFVCSHQKKHWIRLVYQFLDLSVCLLTGMFCYVRASLSLCDILKCSSISVNKWNLFSLSNQLFILLPRIQQVVILFLFLALNRELLAGCQIWTSAGHQQY